VDREGDPSGCASVWIYGQSSSVSPVQTWSMLSAEVYAHILTVLTVSFFLYQIPLSCSSML